MLSSMSILYVKVHSPSESIKNLMKVWFLAKKPTNSIQMTIFFSVWKQPSKRNELPSDRSETFADNKKLDFESTDSVPV